MSSTPLNVFRWTALGAGVLYGFAHNLSLSSAASKKRAALEWSRKETLIAEAKQEYAKLHPKPVAATSSSAALDINDANFDLDKYLSSL